MTVKEIGVDRLTPLRSGAIAATLLGEPQRSEAFGLGLRVIADLYAEKIPWLYSGLTVDRGYLKDNRDALKRFMRATIEGNYLAITDDKRAKAVLAQGAEAHRPEDHRPELRQLQSRDADQRRDRPHRRREHPLRDRAGRRQPQSRRLYRHDHHRRICARKASSPRWRRNTASSELAYSATGCEFDRESPMRVQHWLIASAVFACVPAAIQARPFNDPRSDRIEAIDADAKFAAEPRDPACHAPTLASTGGALPKNPHTLAVRWTGYANYELAYNGQIVLLDAYFDRGAIYPPRVRDAPSESGSRQAYRPHVDGFAFAGSTSRERARRPTPRTSGSRP